MPLQFSTSSLKDMFLYSNYIDRFIDERCSIEDRNEVWSFLLSHPKIGSAIARSYRMSNDERVKTIVSEVSKPVLSAIVAGTKGSGKTALMHFLGEQFHIMTGHNVCVFNPINYRQKLLPKYFYDAYDKSEIRQNDMVLGDEMAITASSRRSMSGENLDLSFFLFLQRHTGNPTITAQQVMGTEDINIVRMADNFLFKRIGLIQLQKDRKRNDPMFIFLDFLRPIEVDEVLFMSANMEKICLAKMPLPTFWSDELSRPGARITEQDAVKKARELYNKGVSLKKISFRLKLLGWDWSESECLAMISSTKEQKPAKANRTR